MRAVIAMFSLGFIAFSLGTAAETIARWEERPFFARRAGQKVPPPAYFATTKMMPAAAEVRIKVVKCPKDASLEVRRFIGGPVFSTGGTKYAPLTANKKITHTLKMNMKVAITTNAGGQQGRCKSISRKDGYDVLTYSFDKLGDLVLQVEVVRK